MKYFLKLLSISLLSLSFLSISSADDFKNTYLDLVDGMTTDMPVLTEKNSIASAGSTQMKLDINSGSEGVSMSMNMNYSQVVDKNRRGLSSKIAVAGQGTLNIDIMGVKVENMRFVVVGDAVVTNNMAYINIKDFSINGDNFSSEIQEQLVLMNMGIRQIKGKWIKIPLPKEFAEGIKVQNNITPDMILSMLKKYPIIKNAGYENGAYDITLNAKNIVNITNRIMKKMTGENMSLKNKREMYRVFKKMDMKGTMTDGESPIVEMNASMIIDEDPSQKAEMTMKIGEGDMEVSANLLDKNGDVMIDYSVAKSEKETSYDINISGDMDSQDIDFSFYLQGVNSRKNLNDYRVIRPRGAMTMEEIEKEIEQGITNNISIINKKAIEEQSEILELFNEGYKLLEEGKWAESEIIFQNLSEITEDSAIYNNLCRVQIKQGKYDEALLNCNEAVRIQPNNAAALDSRAVLYSEMGEYEKALIDSNKALDLYPNDSDIQNTNSKILEKLSQ